MTNTPFTAPPDPGPSASLVGPVSLGIAVGGAVLCHALVLTRIVPPAAWMQIVRSGFEAATVGGLADWFAVTALFRHPFGIPIPHTAIIPKRRQKLIEGAVTIVQEEWLSPEVIGQRVSRARPAEALRAFLADPARVSEIQPTLRTLLLGLSSALTQKEVVDGLDRVIRDQLKSIPIDGSAGHWLERLAASDNAIHAFDALARSMAGVARQPGTARRMHEWLEHTARHMEEDGKRLIPLLLRSHTVRRRVVEAACHFAATELDHASHEADHPLRRHALEALGRYAGRVASNEAEVLAQLEALRHLFLENLSTDPLSAQPLGHLKRQLVAELERPDGPLLAHATEQLRQLVLRMLEPEAARAELDLWVRRHTIDLVTRHHSQIGLTIRESLESLDTASLVAQVEARLGPDLQYVRLNGAIVGGIIGMLLALVRIAVG